MISSIKVTGKGALLGMFCTEAYTRLSGVRLIDGSDTYQRQLEVECGLVSKGFLRVEDAQRIGAVCGGMGAPETDVTVHFEEPHHGSTVITTTGRSGMSGQARINWKSMGLKAINQELHKVIARLQGM